MRWLWLLLLFGGCNHVAKQNIIEINSVPAPFDANGLHPYVVWANGKRINMPKEDIMALVDKIGKENIKPATNKDAHLGWIYSHAEGDPWMHEE